MMRKICRAFIINLYLQLDPSVFFDVHLPPCHLQASSYYFISSGYYWNPGFSNLCRIRDILSQIPQFDNSNKVTAPEIKHLPDAMTNRIDPIDAKLLFNVTLFQKFKGLTQFLKLTLFNPFVEGLNSASADLVTWKQLKAQQRTFYKSLDDCRNLIVQSQKSLTEEFMQEKKLIAERQEEMINELRKKEKLVSQRQKKITYQLRKEKKLIAQKQKEITEELAKERALFAEDRKHMYDFIKTNMKRFEEVNFNLDSIYASLKKALPNFFSLVVPTPNPRQESTTLPNPTNNSTLINEAAKIPRDENRQPPHLAPNSQQTQEDIIRIPSEDLAFKQEGEKPKKKKKKNKKRK
jgi:hypothetical protein